jgi:hypothetical protein
MDVITTLSFVSVQLQCLILPPIFDGDTRFFPRGSKRIAQFACCDPAQHRDRTIHFRAGGIRLARQQMLSELS